MSASFNGTNVLEGIGQGATRGAIGGVIGGTIGVAGTGLGVPEYVSAAVGSAASCKVQGCSDDEALNSAFISLGASATNALVAPSEGRPLTAGEKQMLTRDPKLRGIDLDTVRVHRGGIYTWGGSAVTMDNHITFPSGDYSGDFSASSVSGNLKGVMAHEIFHVFEYQTSHYHWTEAMIEQIRFMGNPYAVPGTHEHRAGQFQKQFQP